MWMAGILSGGGGGVTWLQGGRSGGVPGGGEEEGEEEGAEEGEGESIKRKRR